ncbi:nuclease-related domain-containing protein [Trinickia acidisoli]|uniref:nuclease-related domain-containing protein n=1 Tax=Trinickia acidisoli TaxID=2767482 RepID=UPI001A9040C8|nr:nuclease-related domain-containing protein [Trinickia acidisoli]
MPNIELYVGKRKRRQRSEEIVLSRVLDWLIEHEKQAVIFCDIWIGNQQVDILVGTESTTLQFEVKGWRSPVKGGQNGDWEVTRPDGTTALWKNGYRQALDNNQSLRDEMSRFLRNGVDVPFPKGAVVFEPRIHPDSEFDIRQDSRVAICGSDQIGDLLGAPRLNPWRLSWMRDLAQTRRYIRLPLPKPAVDYSSHTLDKPQIGAAALPNAGYEATPIVVIDRRDSFMRTVEHARPTRREVVPQAPLTERVRTEYTAGRATPSVFVPVHSRDVPRGPGRWISGLLRYTPILFALLAAAYTFKAVFPHVHKDLPSNVAAAQRPAAAYSQSRRAFAHAHFRVIHPKATPVHAGATAVNPAVRTSMSPTYETSAPAASITCPTGVDRLGCNGRVGIFSTPECPPGFEVSGNTCARAAGD